MASVAFVADAQGFILNNQFVPRELTIKDNSRVLHYEFRIEFDDFSEEERMQSKITSSKVHGLCLHGSYWSPLVPAS